MSGRRGTVESFAHRNAKGVVYGPLSVRYIDVGMSAEGSVLQRGRFRDQAWVAQNITFN